MICYNKCNISYAKVSSVTFPKLKNTTATVKVRKSNVAAEASNVAKIFMNITFRKNDENDDMDDDEDDADDFSKSYKIKKFETFHQEGLSDLIKDLDLSKESTELLASTLKEKNILDRKTKVTFYRNRETK